MWMPLVLCLAGFYCVAFALVTLAWPDQAYAQTGLDASGHHMLVRLIGMFYLVFGCSYFLAARDPLRHWRIVLLCVIKILIVLAAGAYAWWEKILAPPLILLLIIDDLLWLLPFLMILWAAVQANLGRPPLYQEALSTNKAAEQYRLSTGETLAEASDSQLVVLVFLRHFGCTFTRQLLRGLELIEQQTAQRGARLVLVHMLQSGKETAYLGDKSGVARIADPYCELYRSFGLGKAGFWELFGPRVWWRGLMALFRGCGVGHLAGDGLQMPGVFLFYRGGIVAAQPAKNAADMPDLDLLFAHKS
ncbi:MAG: hypothetical protein RLZZ553_721 [Verrucomicrobiota bacterium]|jgi:hypothetical protein